MGQAAFTKPSALSHFGRANVREEAKGEEETTSHSKQSFVGLACPDFS